MYYILACSLDFNDPLVLPASHFTDDRMKYMMFNRESPIIGASNVDGHVMIGKRTWISLNEFGLVSGARKVRVNFSRLLMQHNVPYDIWSAEFPTTGSGSMPLLPYS